MNKLWLTSFIKNAINEDIGDGDHTSLACIPPDITGKAKLLIKENGIIAGIEIAQLIFNEFDSNFKFEIFKKDGDICKPSEIAFYVEGRAILLLQAERLVLNVMQRMSGIATQTNLYVKELSGLKTKILDTRKTTPGFRFFEKEAVKIGGGVNHRFGLFDMILIKDNHIVFAGGIKNSIKQVNEYLQKNNKQLKIEIEARNISDVKEIIRIGNVNRIMLDNFSIENTKIAIDLINKKFETESSGGITLQNIRKYAECGGDFISVGALTHHIKSLDLSLKAV
ncbi:MAG: nicotinate-nucleotide diphosphorylase (carboxylating) [Bacteroidetes bacterium CG02_land_8_20_14_3_00_31_25]|nr:MAG: nicotinate-nucleotide diphosphorylase (carboxylating) [Bacteroidetes bacterium CG02_land_8_20_14_3_00_31_25]PIX35985.1 MAG: nicotinate-nucleotide diphosphorylase (carboxylating) [Bacteroidetes bacterium CG_4_8_14_3_um_filter_31_14]